MKYQFGDLVVEASKAKFSFGGAISWGIRIFTTQPKEKISRSTHVAMVTKGGDRLKDCFCVEAVAKGVKIQKVGKPYKVVVYRLRGMKDEICLANLAVDLKGGKYGFVRIGAHFFDWLGSRGRKYTWRKRIPGGLAGRECSNVIAYLWNKCMGLTFGVPQYAASPDDIDDYCASHVDKYQVIRPWGRYKGKKEN